MIKIFTKEDWIPPFADKPVFVLAPAMIMVTVLMSFAVVPFAPGYRGGGPEHRSAVLPGDVVLGVYSVVLAGWASNSKYSLLGGLRAAAQMISYEVFMGLSLMGVVLLAGSFNLGDIVEAQRGLWFCVPQFLGLRRLHDRGPGRDAPAALRPARGARASWWPAFTPSTRA